MKQISTASCGVALLAALAATSSVAQTLSKPHDEQDSVFDTTPEFVKSVDTSLESYEKFGVHLRGSVVNAVAGNTSGGVRQATTNVGQGQLGADLDLQRILGIPSAWIHITEFHDYGSALNLKAIGNSIKEQGIYRNPYNAFHFGLFTYEQKLLNDRLDVAGGRTSTASYFSHLDYACRFMSGTQCGLPGIVITESGYTLLPSGTWGTAASYHFTPNLYLSAGGFEINSSKQNSSGFDWRTDNATGVVVPVELGYENHVDPYPFEIKGGGWYSNGKHSDPYLNTAGKSLGLYGGTAKSVEDRSGLYLMGDKQVYHFGTESDSHYLALIGGYYQILDPTEVLNNQAFAGAVLVGPFASRPDDSIDFMINYFRISGEEIAYLQDARIKAGGSGVNNPNEFSLELNYDYEPFPGAQLMPDIQYIINPDNSNLPHTKTVPHNALVLGLMAQLSFGGAPFASGRHASNGNSDEDQTQGEDQVVDPRTWNGFYAGPQLGYGFGLDNRTGVSTVTGKTLFSNNSAPKDVIYGAHLGYNFVLPSFALYDAHVLLGVEGDGDGTTGMKTYTLYQTVSGQFRDTVEGSVRGRVGLDFGKYMVYGTGGFAVGNLRNTYRTSSGGVDSVLSARPGYTIGAGVEYALSMAWSFRVEYRHTSFDDDSQLLTNTERGLVIVRHEDTEDRVEAGLSYRLNFPPPPAPVLAKY